MRIAPLLADALELGNILEIDQMLGGGEPELHHRDEAVAAATTRASPWWAASSATASLIPLGR